MPIIFKGNERLAYRDPTCCYIDGRYHLFFTVSEKADGYMYNYTAHSTSCDLVSFSEPRIITERDVAKNFCSPGNVIKRDDKYLICITSYPMPLPYAERHWADESARLYFIETEDFISFSEPYRIYPKGRGCEDEGRMIDPFILETEGRYILFFKQNGVSISDSRDLKEWEYKGRIDGGENACVLHDGEKYILIHSPENGIGIKESRDLKSWLDLGTYMPDVSREPWANGRLTAAFAIKNERADIPYRYAVFFHGSRKDSYPETHGEASLAMCYTDDFKKYYFDV